LSGRSHRVLTAIASARPRIRSKSSEPPVPTEPTEPTDGEMESRWHP
jgi:hypothetical protein